MINLTDISSGWATLRLGYCSFDISYLSDIKYEMDYLLDILDSEDNDVKKIILEGEGQGDLSLIAHLTFEDLNNYSKTSEKKDENYGYVLNIIWQRILGDYNNSITLLKFPFDEFKDEYERLMLSIKDDYIKNFLCLSDEEELEND